MKKSLALFGCIVIILAQIPFISVNAESGAPVNIELKHVHSGDDDTSGGCYDAVYHVHTGSSEKYGGCYTVKSTNIINRCDACENNDHANHVGTGSCWYDPDYGYHCNCGEIVTTYKLGCGRDSTKIDGYKLNCGLAEGEVIGIFTLKPKENSYSNSNQITASVTSLNSKVTIIEYKWNTGATAESIVSEQNGTYTCSLTYSDHGTERSQDLSINIDNIDNLAPQAEVTFEAGWSKEDVTVTLNAEDVPGTALSCCSGLPAEAYSWDGGTTWGTVTEQVFGASNSFEIWIRDNAGNITKKNVDLKIDKLAPIVELNTEAVSGEIAIMANAEDVEDVSGGNATQISGLPAEAYSWDGGNTWTDNNCLLISKNGSYSVSVRDNAGNIATASISINSFIVSTPAPVLPSPAPEEPPVPSPVPTPKPTPEQKPIVSIKPVPPTETESPPEETPVLIPITTPKLIPVPSPAVEEEIVTVTIKEEDSPKVHLISQIIATSAGASTATGGITFIIVFWIFRKCQVVDESGKVIGKAYVWKKKKQYFIKISDKISKKAGSRFYINFKKNFVKANLGKPVDIIIGGKKIEKDLKEKICITI